MTKNEKAKQAGTLIYKMLSFQYKPIEQRLKKALDKKNWDKYNKMSAGAKMMFLDKIAQKLGY